MTGMNDNVGHYECGECEHWIRWVDSNEIGHGMTCSYNPNRIDPADLKDDE
jgi:hypothetical protein